MQISVAAGRNGYGKVKTMMIEDNRAEQGLADAPANSSKLVTELYSDLKRLAHRERVRVGSPPTLQTTALIHEAYLKLHRGGVWNDRMHFMRAAATAMRQVLVDAARARLTLKRGEGVHPLELEDEHIGNLAQMSDDIIVNIDDALQKLGDLSPRLAQVVECRFFAGYTEAETAQALEVTSRTIERDWVKAKAWLYQELRPL